MSDNDEYIEVEHKDNILKVAREHHKWLGVVDIIDSAPLRLTIKRLFRFENGIFHGGRKQDGQAIEFVGGKKYLVLNVENSVTLYECYGKTAEELAGKQIELHVEKLKREFRGKTHGIRIR